MRRTFLIGTLLLTFSALNAAQVFGENLSIDGRMVVAGEGELPPGLFVKAQGYLPGDTISLTNPTTGKQISLLNLGTLDPSGGVTLLLSPESAESLGVSAGENMDVKLNQRSEMYDSLVTGNAFLSAPEKKSEPVLASTNEITYDEGDYSYDDYDDDGDFLSYKKNIEQPSPADEFPIVAENDSPASEPLAQKEPEVEAEVEPLAYERFEADELPLQSSFADQIKDEPAPAADLSPAEEVAAAEPLPKSEPDFSLEPVSRDELLAFSPLRENTLEEHKNAEAEENVKPESDSLYELVNDAEPPLSMPEEIPSENEDEPLADFSQEDQRSWEAEAIVPEEPIDEPVAEPEPELPQIDENRAASKDAGGEDVASVEPAEKVIEEPIDEPLIEEPVIEEPSVDENRPVAGDLAGEEVTSLEPAPKVVEEEPLPVETIPEEVVPEEVIDENRAVASDKAGEEVISAEPAEKEPLVEEPALDEKAGEEVSANEPEPEFDENRPVQSDLAGEEVNSAEPKEKEPSLEEKEGEDVTSVEPEPGVDEGREVAADLEGENVAENEPVLAPEVSDEPEVEVVSGEEDNYSAIVLIPADAKVPEAEEAPLEITPVPVKEEEKPALTGEGIASHLVESENLLPAGYYVQIATMESQEALESLLKTYYKYPLVFLKTKSGAYRVLIGKLSEDEYGAVLAKFKAFGFKDAFLRHLK